MQIHYSSCPFCGGQGELKKVCPDAMPGSIVVFAFVECIACKAKGPPKYDWDNPEYENQAVVAWNSRAK